MEVLLSLIKERNLLVKIDTNGAFPSRLQELIQAKLIDFVAMDVKAALERYEEVVKSPINTEDILKSIAIIKDSGLEYIFRTTVVPGLVSSGDIIEIGQILKGTKIFQIQQFVAKSTIDDYYNQIIPYSKQEIQAFAKIAEPYFEEVRVESL